MPGKGVGSSNNYAYLVVDDKSKDAFIIDPANPPEYGPPLDLGPRVLANSMQSHSYSKGCHPVRQY